MEADTRRKILSTNGVVVKVNTEDIPCPQCSEPTHVQKTVERTVVIIEHGGFVAKETVRVCVTRCTDPSGQLVTVRSGELSHLVAPGATYGYDVEIWVGLERYLRHRQREEIRVALKQEHGITLSSGEVSILADRFLQHLEMLHRSRTAALREALAQDGGYPLHFDATGEDGRGTLFVAYAGWRGWVLGSWKLSTERADQILPCLKEVVDLFGPPVSLMRDLGRAAILAAENLVEGPGREIPILNCHLHFLKDIGKDLLEASYDELRSLVHRFRLMPELRKVARDLGRRLGSELPALRDGVSEWAESAIDHELPKGITGLAIVRSLVQWVLDYSANGHHLGFPFDRPYLDLYNRCHSVRRAIDAYLRRPPHDAKVCRALHRFARILDPVVSEARFASVAGTLADGAALFDELRGTLRLNHKYSTNPAISSDLSAGSVEHAIAELKDVQQALESLTDSLRNRRPERGPAQDTRKAIDIILQHLYVHGPSLWGHVIQLPEKIGGGVRIVDRTNNLMEGFFHQMKHGERRRSGRKVLTHDFESLPAAASLAYNLTHPDYVELLCGSLDALPAAFAEIDAICHTHALTVSPALMPAAMHEIASASLPRTDLTLVRSLSIRKRIEAAAKSRAPHCILAGK
ncbi:MAG: hypothetical protein AB2L14_28685 [Candidatus Xenobiia bacterium LiM19]